MSQSVSQQEPRGGDVSVNGLKLHYLDWGGDGRPIVILHATGFLGRIYRPIAEALTSIGHVYSYDQRGHGDSEHPKTDLFEWQATVKDLEGFISPARHGGCKKDRNRCAACPPWTKKGEGSENGHGHETKKSQTRRITA